MAPPRRFHHMPAPARPADEALLQHWWRVLDDAVLDRLVTAALQQNIELSLASLQVARQCGGRDAPFEQQTLEQQTLERLATEPDCLAAWSAFHALRLRTAAAVVRAYVTVVSLQERMVCAALAMSLQQALQQRGRADSERHGIDAAFAAAASVADLHAHHVRLRGERDGAVAALARLVGEPLELTLARVEGRMLPPGVAAVPPCGGPDALLQRRPELVAAGLQVEAASRDPARLRWATTTLEQRHDTAVAEVERALAMLTAAISESAPVRATALTAGTLARQRVQQLLKREADVAQVLESDRLYHARCDREIETRARGWLALADLCEALGAGWPAPVDDVAIDEAGAAR